LQDFVIPNNDLRTLSEQIYVLGAQWMEINDELNAAGYGEESSFFRRIIEDSCVSKEDLSRLHKYWGEWAKEKLAGVGGQTDILRGVYSPYTAFRSKFIDSLRDDLLNGKIESQGKIVTRQIEPTLKKYIESGPSPQTKSNFEKSRSIKKSAIADHGMQVIDEFPALKNKERFKLLRERYCLSFDVCDFKIDTSSKTYIVFKRVTTNQKWEFFLFDDCFANLEIGQLSPMFGLAYRGSKLSLKTLQLNSVLRFSPEDIIPYFRASRNFAWDSHQEFCLAADTIARLAIIIFQRLDRLIK